MDYKIIVKDKIESDEVKSLFKKMGFNIHFDEVGFMYRYMFSYSDGWKVTADSRENHFLQHKNAPITIEELRTLAQKEYLDENYNLVYGDGFYIIPDGSTFASGDDFGNIVFRKDGFYFEKGEWKRTATTLDNSVSLGLNIVWQRNNKCADNNVNHPSHYTTHPSGIECIDITRHHDFAIGNAIKYLWRAGLKDSDNEVQDLKKAIWYIQDKINQLGG